MPVKLALLTILIAFAISLGTATIAPVVTLASSDNAQFYTVSDDDGGGDDDNDDDDDDDDDEDDDDQQES